MSKSGLLAADLQIPFKASVPEILKKSTEPISL